MKEKPKVAKITDEKGHFFDAKQKAAKHRIIVDVMDAVMKGIRGNAELFAEPQLLSDLITTVMIVFNREMMRFSSDMFEVSDRLLLSLWKGINQEVKKQIGELRKVH